MKKRVVTINKGTCRCCCSLADKMFDEMKVSGMVLREGTDVLMRITEWEAQHRTTASVKSYIALYMALFRDAKEEDTVVYIPGYESILNAISVRQGKVAARNTLEVLSYANAELGVIQFPAPGIFEE